MKKRSLIVLVVAVATLVLVGVPAHANHNDSFVNGERIASSPIAIGHSTVGAALNESGEPAPCGAINRTVWYRFTPALFGTVTLNTFGSPYDTVLAVYQSGSHPVNANRLSGIAIVGCNDDSSGTLQSLVSFGALPNRTYFIQLGGFVGQTGSFTLNVSGPSPAAAPSNDDFAGGIAVGTGSTSGSTVGGSVQPLEPRPCGGILATTWYRFTAPVNGAARVTTFGSTFDTVVAVHTGSDVGSLSTLGCNDDSGGLQSLVNFTGTAGTTYHLQIGGFFGNTGPLVLNIATVPSKVTGLAAHPGGSIGFIDLSWSAPSANGSPIASYQIERNGTVVGASTTTSFTDTGLAALSKNTYRVRALNSLGAGEYSDSVCQRPFPWLDQLGCTGP